jgi:predicted helicase
MIEGRTGCSTSISTRLWPQGCGDTRSGDGDGDFICDIIEYLPEGKLEHKYKNEMHCNEVAILPYYIANLNIEATYKQKWAGMRSLAISVLSIRGYTAGITHSSKQGMFGFVSAENAERVKRQNKKKISVIIAIRRIMPSRKLQLSERQHGSMIYRQADT